MIPGVHPWGGGRWVDGGGGGHGYVKGCPMHTRMHAHASMHAHTCMLNMLNMINMDASVSVAICNFYKCINVCVCMCMHVHTCVCVWGHPHAPRCPPSTCPLPRATGSPKHQNSISPELIEIIRFCLKILYL